MARKFVIIFFLISFLFIVNCGSGVTRQFENGKSGASTWVYQLQHPKIKELSESGFSLAVIDYSPNGTDKKRFSEKDLQQLVAKNITPIAYISIGEAETYRFYWKKNWVDKKIPNRLTSAAPSWLGHGNPNWAGNYKVRYWEPDWRDNFIKPYLDKIIRQGFHGVYLDIIDGFEYWSDRETYDNKLEEKRENDPVDDEGEAARRMIELVDWIARYGKKHSPLGDDFMIFPQNGERILLYDNNGTYLNAVSGIGVEDTWYNAEEEQPGSWVNGRLHFLKKFREKGKLVLSVDYVDSGDHKNRFNLKRIRNYVSKCRSQGFRCYAGNSDVQLKTINRIQGIQP